MGIPTCCERCGLRRRLLPFRRFARDRTMLVERWFCLECYEQVRNLVTHYQTHIESVLRDRWL